MRSREREKKVTVSAHMAVGIHFCHHLTESPLHLSPRNERTRTRATAVAAGVVVQS